MNVLRIRRAHESPTQANGLHLDGILSTHRIDASSSRTDDFERFLALRSSLLNLVGAARWGRLSSKSPKVRFLPTLTENMTAERERERPLYPHREF
jgi:hypothetical protein